MGAMLLARSATASTGWRNASSEPQPEPLILGLVPDQPAPGAVTDRVHKAIYCRRQAAELSQPGCLTGPGSPGQPTRAGRCRRRCRQRRVNPRRRQTSSGPAASQVGGRHGCAAFSVAESGATRTHSASALTCGRNEHFVHAHIYARTGILTCSLDFAGGCRAVLSIVLVGNKIADFVRPLVRFLIMA